MKFLNNLSKRDKIFLIIVVTALVIFLYYTYILDPLLKNTESKKADIVSMESDLESKRAIIAALPNIENDRISTINEIESIADNYLPDLTTQFYYDLLNQKAHETSLAPTGVRTEPLSAAEATAEKSNERKANSLSTAIGEYANAVSQKPKEEKTDQSNQTDRPNGRYEFKYIPITYTVTDGDFSAVQAFIQSLNDLNYTMYFKSANIKANDHLTLDAEFEIYFISIDRMFDVTKDAWIYETIPPAGNDDNFFYYMKKENLGAGI